MAKLAIYLRWSLSIFACAAIPTLAFVLPAAAQGGEGAVAASCTTGIPGKRVALVIGNGAYGEFGKLDNPPNDAEAMTEALTALKFDVMTVKDGNIDQLQRALRQFGRAAVNADVALFFYAGHGMSLKGENYLLPIAAHIGIETDLPYEALTLAEVQRQLEFSEACVSLVILDACRDNPLGRTLKRNAAQLGRSAEIGEGLAKVDLNDASGMYIAYSTAPGSVALDGTGQVNSPFTTALLEHLAEPNVDVRVMFGRVRSAVFKATKEFQVPWTEDGLLGDFYLNPVAVDSDFAAWQEIAESSEVVDFEQFLQRFPDSVLARAADDRLEVLRRGLQLTSTPLSVVAATPGAPPDETDPGLRLTPRTQDDLAALNAPLDEIDPSPQDELAAWNALQGNTDPEAWEAFLATHPSGTFATPAGLFLQGLLWRHLAETEDTAALEDFLARFPSGPYTSLAAVRLSDLEHLHESTPAPGGAGPDAQALALSRTGELPPNLLQIALEALGHYAGRIDGLIGPGSRQAISKFQKGLGAEPTGVLTPEQTLLLIEQAAKRGDAQSQNTYGIMYGKGIGVAQDQEVAAFWFEKAADQANSIAQVNLALLYKDGLGVRQDVGEAIRLLKAAAESGQEDAPRILNELAE